MASRKIRGNKVKISHTQKQTGSGSLWLAGIGALSIARKRGKALLGEMIAEGQRLQTKAVTMVHEARADTRAQFDGFLTPVRQRLEEQVEKGGKAVQAGIGGVLSKLGIPSKADIDELAQRVGALSRQLKTGR
ncbi:MAG TPA: phasin family protein [Rudaea sp.]|nr:phasin family protein [Rudaea sp.]